MVRILLVSTMSKLRRITLIAAFVVLILRPGLTWAGVTETVLNNGLKVIIAEDHKVPLAVFEIWYRVGAMDDPGGRSGLSHLLEHMMFKGTPKYGSKVFSRLVMKYGGIDNAFTSANFTGYYQMIPPERIGISIDLESDRMRNLIMDEKEFLSERDVVREERRMRYEDNPQTSLGEEVDAMAFKVHPYHRPVIGWMSDLNNISRADLISHYRKYYSPENAVIVVVGDVDPKKLLKQIRDSFGRIRNNGPIVRDIATEPAQQGERRVTLHRKAELPYLLAAYHVPSLPDNDSYALDVFSEIVGGGKSGRFYRSLVYEKKLALSASTSYDSLNRDPYLFSFEATAAADTDVAVLERAIYAEIERMKTEPPTEFELQKAKNSTEALFIKFQDSIFNQARMIAQFEILGGGWRKKDEYTTKIRQVTADDVMRVARKYFSEDQRTVGVLLPLESGATK